MENVNNRSLTRRWNVKRENSCGIKITIFENDFKLYAKRVGGEEVAGTIIVRCGSVYEKRGQNNGISHLVEHLVYAGGPNGGRRSSPMYKIERLGDEVEPDTGCLYTKYNFVFARKRWARNLKLLIGAIMDLQFSPAVFRQEQRVAANEKVNDTEFLSVAATERAFRGHPMGMPIDGTLRTISSLTPRKIRNWHRRFYRPERMSLVIVGNISRYRVINVLKKTGILDARRKGYGAEIKEPLPTTIKKSASRLIKNTNCNSTTVIFNGPKEPRNKFLFNIYFNSIVYDDSIVGMRWSIERHLGLHLGISYTENSDAEFNDCCSYFYINFFAPSKKILDKLEKRFFSWADRISSSGLSRDIFMRIHSNVLKRIKEGCGSSIWWREEITGAIAEGYFYELRTLVKFQNLSALELKKEVETLLGKIFSGKKIIVRARTTHY